MTRSIRRTLANLLVCALACVAATSAMAQQPPPQEVTLNMLTRGEPETLDPQRVSFADAVDGAVVRQVFEPLLRFDQDLVPRPAAAERYEVSLDGTVYTFHLRQDARWSDGQPVTARHFEYSWKRLLDPSVHADDAALFVDAGIVGADDFNAGRTANANKVGVTALDDDTLQVRLTQPFGAFADLAALWVGAPLRPDVIAADPDGWAQDPTTYIGNGPFMLSEWVHQDHLTLVPNPQYRAHLTWPAPTLTRASILMGTHPEADLAAFKQGSRDWVQVPDTKMNQVLNDPVLGPQTRQSGALTTFWLAMNGARPPLDNVLVRRALSKAIDRRLLVRDLATDIGQPATSVLPPGMPGFQDDLGQELGFDASGANALLAQAGFDGTQPLPTLTFTFPDTPADWRRAQWLHAEWNLNLGIQVDLNAVDAAAYDQAIASKEYDLALGGWQADYPDPQDWFGILFGCDADHNTFSYCNPSFDQLVARADTTSVGPDRLHLYAQAQMLLLQDVPVAPLFVPHRLLLVQPWVRSSDGGALPLSPLDEYPGSLFLDRVEILPH